MKNTKHPVVISSIIFYGISLFCYGLGRIMPHPSLAWFFYMLSGFFCICITAFLLWEILKWNNGPGQPYPVYRQNLLIKGYSQMRGGYTYVFRIYGILILCGIMSLTTSLSNKISFIPAVAMDLFNILGWVITVFVFLHMIWFNYRKNHAQN